MKAPDKIYYYKGSLGSPNVSEKNIPELNTTEYIRKEAILDYLRKKKVNLKNDAEGCSNPMAINEYLSIDNVISIIESL